MIYEEKIDVAAKKFADDQFDEIEAYGGDTGIDDSLWSAYYYGFIEGAKWHG